MRPLYAGDDHNLLRNRDHGNPHPMYGTKDFILNIAVPFYPLANLGLQSDTGAIVTGAFQNALDTMPAGMIGYVGPGEYLIDGSGLVPQSHSGLFLAPGALINQTVGLAVLNVAGTATATTTTCTVTPAASDYQITVVATTAFAAGDWIEIKDAQAPSDGSSTAVHREIHRVRAIISGTVLSLYYPMLDTYSSGTITVTKINVLEDFWLGGSGALTNPQTGASQGRCLRVGYAVRCTFQDIEIYDMGYEAVGFHESAFCTASKLRIHDAIRFYTGTAGTGYGITSTSSHTLSWVGNTIERTRHALDVSFFSQGCALTGNVINGTGATAIQTHPDVRGITVTANTINGSIGHASGSSPEYDPANPASGIGVRENADGVTIGNNTINGVGGSGITIHGDDSRDIRVHHNVITNANFLNGQTHAGIRALGTDSSVLCPGLQIDHNTIKASPGATRWGILVGYSGAKVHHNDVDGFPRGVVVQSRITSTVVDDIEVTDNTITNGQFGVWLGGSLGGGTGANRLVRRVVVSRNKISAMTREGIGHSVNSTNDYCEGGTIEGNKIIACNGDNNAASGGIVLVESATVASTAFRYTVSKNYTKDNNIQGINVTGDGSCIEENECDTEIARGIFINPGTTTAILDLSVKNNRAHHCGNEGIRVGPRGGGGVVVQSPNVTGNECWMNDDSGLVIEDDCAGAYVKDNKCWNNDQSAGGFAGLGIRGDNARVFENECYDSQGAPTQQFGILVNATADATVLRNNWCEGNVTAPYSIAGTNTRFTDTAGTTATAGNANTTIVLPTRVQRWSTVLTAPRTALLPAANVVDYEVWVVDNGAVNGANTITPTAAGADVFDETGAAAGPVMTVAFSALHIKCVAQGRWKVL